MKTVETHLIGAFVQDQATTCKFYPSPEYLEAGNFKMHRDLYQEFNGSTYPLFYNHLLKDKDIIPVNFSSIAMVCNIKTDKAKGILTDIFSCLIELGRSNHSVIKMNL